MPEESTRTVERALSLLGVVCAGEPMTAAACAREVDLSPSTTIRLLRTLQLTGFVVRDDDGTYAAGPRLVQLGTLALSQQSVIGVCHDEMASLVDASRESVYLSVIGHGHTALYVAIVEGSHSVRHTSWVGRSIPIEGTAAGQVLTGEVPSEGYVVVARGLEPDVTSISAPVRCRGQVVAAMSLLVPSYRVTEEEANGLGRELARRVARCSAKLDGSSAEPVA